MAAVVVSTPPMSCRLDRSGAVILDQIENLAVWGYGPDGAKCRVFVLSEDALTRFAEELSARATAWVQGVGGIPSASRRTTTDAELALTCADEKDRRSGRLLRDEEVA